MSDRDKKPLGRKSFGTIPHLPGSRQGRDDVGLEGGQARICLKKVRDKRDRVIVTEKLDGSNVAVANIEGNLVPLIRAGYAAVASRYEQHRLFHVWVMERLELFAFLLPGERMCGEWLAQAHGTRYELKHEPFVPFDIIRAETGAPKEGDRVLAHVRAPYDEFTARVRGILPLAELVFDDNASCAINRAMQEIDRRNAHGALDPIEGAVWRIERNGEVDFLAKFVRHGKVDGVYLPELSGKPPIWNWRPGKRK